jgi:hypothetical protein
MVDDGNGATGMCRGQPDDGNRLSRRPTAGALSNWIQKPLHRRDGRGLLGGQSGHVCTYTGVEPVMPKLVLSPRLTDSLQLEVGTP